MFRYTVLRVSGDDGGWLYTSIKEKGFICRGNLATLYKPFFIWKPSYHDSRLITYEMNRKKDTNRWKLAKLSIFLVLLKDEHKVRLPLLVLVETVLMDHIFSCQQVWKDKFECLQILKRVVFSFHFIIDTQLLAVFSKLNPISSSVTKP